MPARESLVGQRFGRLLVIEELPFRQLCGQWHCQSLCLCDCGKKKATLNYNLKKGRTKSCGCLSIELASARSKTHGMSKTPLYMIWGDVVKRCENPKHKYFKDYGGRGIQMCSGWRNSFESFNSDMPPKPNNYTLDRKDNNGNYSCGHCEECIAHGWPMNVRWVTRKDQARNRRSNRMVSYDGKVMCAAAWAEKFGCSPFTLVSRLASGWSMERALTEPVRVKSISQKPIHSPPASAYTVQPQML